MKHSRKGHVHRYHVKMQAAKLHGRICAVCGKRGGWTLGFKGALRELGLANWQDDKAHPACVVKLKNERKDQND